MRTRSHRFVGSRTRVQYTCFYSLRNGFRRHWRRVLSPPANCRIRQLNQNRLHKHFFIKFSLKKVSKRGGLFFIYKREEGVSRLLQKHVIHFTPPIRCFQRQGCPCGIFQEYWIVGVKHKTQIVRVGLSFCLGGNILPFPRVL